MMRREDTALQVPESRLGVWTPSERPRTPVTGTSLPLLEPLSPTPTQVRLTKLMHLTHCSPWGWIPHLFSLMQEPALESLVSQCLSPQWKWEEVTPEQPQQ